MFTGFDKAQWGLSSAYDRNKRQRNGCRQKTSFICEKNKWTWKEERGATPGWGLGDTVSRKKRANKRETEVSLSVLEL